MKNKKFTKLSATLLSALLVVALIVPFVKAETELLPGQKELFVKTVTTPPVQDGILNGHKVNGVTVDEYGSGGPTMCLTAENGDYRAVDLEGNPLNTELPSYIYLYMSKDSDALYVGMEIQEEHHAGDLYEFTTFLGFGDSKDADTMNSGIFTTFKMDNGNSPRNDPGTWMDTQVTALSAQSVAADGTVTDTTESRKFSIPFEYTLPSWASESTSNSLPVTIFEAELDFEDAMLGSGLEKGATLPDYGYFAFELGIFNGTEKIGKIVFNNDMTGKSGAPNGAIKTVPHFLNLKTEFNASSANNANLAELSVEGGTLSPAFVASETNYTLNLPNGTTSANVTATAVASETRVTVEGADTIDNVNFGGNDTITVTCVAQNGFKKVYTLNINWVYDNTDYYVDASAGNDSTGNGSEAAPFATIEKAMQAVSAREWEINEMATIHINGTFDATVTEGVLWGAKTVFTKEATRLPITIKGDTIASDVINAYAGKAACANSYHFDTLTFYIDGISGAQLFAGSGEVRFDNVKWTTASAAKGTSAVFFGDTFTAKVFDGWTETEIEKAKSQSKRGNLVTSLTIGENAEYWIAGSSGQYLNASGDNGGWDNADSSTVKSTDVEPIAILDGSRVSRLAVYYPNSNINTYAHAGVLMLSGSTHRIGVDRNDGSTRLVINNDVSIEVYGGTSVASSSFIRGLCADTVNGNMTITIESGTWQYLQGAMSDKTCVYGDVIMNIGGTANITGHATGGLGSTGSLCSGTVYNRVYGNPTIAKFRASREGTTVVYNKIVNEVSGGTIAEFTGINNKAFASTTTEVINNISGGTITYLYGVYTQDIKSVENNISGGVIQNFYGHYKANAEKVTNKISGTANITNYYGIYDMQTVDGENVSMEHNYGDIKNIVSGGDIGTYIGAFRLSNYTSFENEITGGTFDKFYGVSANEIDAVTNNIEGGVFTTFYGSNQSTLTTLNNNIKGGTFTTFYGSYKDTIITLNNNISGGSFIGTLSVDSSSNEAGLEVLNGSYGSTITTQNNTFTGGSLGGVGGENRSTVTNMNNTFDGATAGRVFGTFQGTATNVHNVILSGTFTQGFDGCYRSTTDSVWTEVKDGEFQKTFYPVWARYATIDTVKTDIDGGTFNGTIHGGYGGAFGSITTNISGGKFSNSSIYLGCGSTTWPSAVLGNVTNNISGGDFTGSTAVYGGGMCGLVKGDIINNITGGTFKVFYGGNYRAYTSTSDSRLVAGTEFKGNSVLGKIANTFGAENAESGPTFNSYVMGGDLGNTDAVIDYCDIENTIHAGTFKSNFYGGTDTANAAPASIKNTVNGGTFEGKFWGGGNDGACIGNIENTITGGTFNGYFFGGARKADVGGDIINTIKGGTWNSYFFGGNDQNTSAATDTVAPTTFTIGGSIKNTISGGTFKSAASGAGFGTITGNVENTIKGDASFELGYYGVQATVLETVVEGNVLNLITKDENGVAPFFAKKNMDIDYVYDNASFAKVFTTSGSNIGFAATAGSGVVFDDDTKDEEQKASIIDYTDVKGYVETIVEAGTFAGHYYAGGAHDIFGQNEDGYGVINIVRGDPVFNYVWAGGCISSSREAAYKTYNEINGGTFNKEFSSFNRTATAGAYTNASEVVTVIKNGVFNDAFEFAEPWNDSHSGQYQRTAPYTLTIEGGIFNDVIYGLDEMTSTKTTYVGPYLKEGGDVTININGGTFAKGIIATGKTYTAEKFASNAYATINIEPTKGDVTILGTVESRFANEKVNLKGGAYKLILGADASIEATSATGDVKLGQVEDWKKQTYVTLPEDNDAIVTVTGPHCFDKIGTSVVAVKGGVQLAGATMILTDRVAVRALFDKESVDSIDNFTFSFTMNAGVLASGNKSDLVEWNDDYYCIVLAKIGAGNFTDTVSFAGSEEVWGYDFSVKSLAELAENAWAGNEVDVQLAKAMQNFATIVKDPTATLPHTLAPDMTKLSGFTATASKEDGTGFVVTGKGLIMGNAVGIRIYGTSAEEVTADSFTIKVNGTDVTSKAIVSAGAGANEYTIDLYVNAKNMSSALNIVITEKASNKVCLNLTDRVDAIAAAYPETHENYAKAQQLLVYIQAAVAYASKG